MARPARQAETRRSFGSDDGSEALRGRSARVTEPDQPEAVLFLTAADSGARDAAWERLVGAYSRLLLSVARGLGGGHDQVMDRYAYVLERLHADDFRRIRAFRRDGSARFSTWLVVIVRRLCIDEYRARFGRVPAASSRTNGVDQLRRRLELGEADALDITSIPDDNQRPPEDVLDGGARSRTLSELLTRLPPRDQLLLQLRFRDGLSAAEIAGILKYRSSFHVYRRVQSLLRELKTALNGHPLFRGDPD